MLHSKVEIKRRKVERRRTSLRAHFEAAATYWRSVYTSTDVRSVIYQQRHAAVLSKIDELKLPAGARVLDAGCGAGLVAAALAAQGLEVCALDIAPAMLAETRKPADDSGGGQNVKLAEGDVRQLPFPDGAFRLVVAVGVLPWAGPPVTAAREMTRVLATGGYLIATVDNRWRLHELMDPLCWLSRMRNLARRTLPAGRDRALPPSCYRASVREMEALLKCANLQKVWNSTLGFGPWTLNRWLPAAVGVAVHRILQKGADRRLALVRDAGTHHIVVGRKATTVEHVSKSWQASV